MDLWRICSEFGGDKDSPRGDSEAHAAARVMIIYLIMSSCLYAAQQSALTMCLVHRPHTETTATPSSSSAQASAEPPGPARHKAALPQDSSRRWRDANESFPKEDDAELLPCSRGADQTGPLTAPDPASDFITFGRESRLVDFSAAWWSGDGAAVLALLPKELVWRNPKTQKSVK